MHYRISHIDHNLICASSGIIPDCH